MVPDLGPTVAYGRRSYLYQRRARQGGIDRWLLAWQCWRPVQTDRSTTWQGNLRGHGCQRRPWAAAGAAPAAAPPLLLLSVCCCRLPVLPELLTFRDTGGRKPPLTVTAVPVVVVMGTAPAAAMPAEVGNSRGEEPSVESGVVPPLMPPAPSLSKATPAPCQKPPPSPLATGVLSLNVIAKSPATVGVTISPSILVPPTSPAKASLPTAPSVPPSTATSASRPPSSCALLFVASSGRASGGMPPSWYSRCLLRQLGWGCPSMPSS